MQVDSTCIMGKTAVKATIALGKEAVIAVAPVDLPLCTQKKSWHLSLTTGVRVRLRVIFIAQYSEQLKNLAGAGQLWSAV